MANLSLALEAQKKIEREEKEKDKKPRVIADPHCTVDQISIAILGLLAHNKTQDLWRLISPPQSMVNVNWQTPVNPEWVVKLAPFAYDLFVFAKNTKLAPTKVKKALAALHSQRNLTIPSHLGLVDDALDHIGLSLRTGLAMFRSLKESPSLKTKVFRVLTNHEQQMVDLTLDRVVLEWIGGDSQEGAAAQPESLPEPLPLQDKKAESATAMPDFAKGLSLEDKKPQTAALSRQNAQDFPEALCEVPRIFAHILGPAKTEKGEEEILQAANNFVAS